jgi:hypothetical protein
MILSHARLPIPTLPRPANYTTGDGFAKQRAKPGFPFLGFCFTITGDAGYLSNLIKIN